VDFKNELKKQLNFLIASCKTYDGGLREEAVRIGAIARVLFHETAKSHSLLRSHMKATGLNLRSTSSELFGPSRDTIGSIGLEPSTGQFRPYLDDCRRDRQIPIDEWWEEPVLMLLQNNETITRRELALSAANKDGGAHVDPKKPSAYDRLEGGLGIRLDVQFSSGIRKLVPLRFANLAALRQIGHEILTSRELVALVQK
jgi:hypothetical protein